MADKKGFVTTGLVTLFLYIGIALLLIIFFFIFKLEGSSRKVEISNKLDALDAGYQLVNYLRAPYELNGEKINMADLIMLYENEKDAVMKNWYEGELKKSTADIFGKMEHCNEKALVSYSLKIINKDSYELRADGAVQPLVMSDNFMISDLIECSYASIPSYTETPSYAAFCRGESILADVAEDVRNQVCSK